MKLLTIGPRQTTSAEAAARSALLAAQVEKYTVYTPRAGESNISAAMRMVRESKSEDFDTVSAQDPFFSGLIAMWIARRTGARLNVQVHADLKAQSLVRHILAQIVLRHADSIRVVSEKLKQQVEHVGVRANIVVLPVFVDVERFKNIERHPEGNTILWVGRFEQEKDPELAIDIVSKIPDAKLIMLGRGSLEAALKEKAKNMPVEFGGWQDPLPFLARADVLINTSPAESFGVSMVEALAAGVPVVAMDVGIAKEAGAIVVPKEKLAEAVTEVLRTHPRGELKLNLLNKDEWIRAWLQSF